MAFENRSSSFCTSSFVLRPAYPASTIDERLQTPSAYGHGHVHEHVDEHGHVNDYEHEHVREHIQPLTDIHTENT